VTDPRPEGTVDDASPRSRVVVMGATEDAPPPRIEVVSGVVDLSFADTSEALADVLPGADIVFAWRPRRSLLQPVWPKADSVKWIQTASAGVDALLFPELVESHVVVTNARGIFDGAIAEYVLGLMLAFAKGLPGMLERQVRKEWEHRDTETLSGKRVLVAGVGSIVREIGRLCGAFGMTVRGVGSTARGRDDVFRIVYGPDELAEACRWADYVVNALPGTEKTKHLFGETVIAAMRPTARFVNIGRGSTVDQMALLDALREGRLAGAALDVFAEEPLPQDSPLWELPNVIVSPHMSGDFAGFREAVVELFVQNLERYLTALPLENVVDKERGYVPS
jgi:phosphoglycerate dehydrogenase-like enzyme